MIVFPDARGFVGFRAAAPWLALAMVGVLPVWYVRVVGAVLALVAVWIARRARRIEVRLTPSALVVTNLWSEHNVAWGRIRSSRVRTIREKYTNFERMLLTLDTGEEIQLDATTTSQQGWSDRMYRLRRDLADYGAFRVPGEP